MLGCGSPDAYKLAYSALIDLNNRVVKYFPAHFAANTWQGFFLKVIDGTTLRLPEIDAIVKHFDPRTAKNLGKCPLARVWQLYDPLNRISCDAIMAPVSQGERDLAVMHFSKLTAGDLVLLDRGYACLWLFDLILSLGANFCVRMPANWKCVQQFLKKAFTCATKAQAKVYDIGQGRGACKFGQDRGVWVEIWRIRILTACREAGKGTPIVLAVRQGRLYVVDASQGGNK